MRTGSLLVVTALFGCSSPDQLFEACAGTAEETLVNGASTESYLGLSEREIRAVVKVTNDRGEEAPVCSGAFVTRDWVVTAAHCLVIESAEVVVPGAEGAPPSVVRVTEGIAHPDLDVALLRVDAPDDGFDSIPLGLAAPGAPAVTVGDVVEIAGYGRTEEERAGELRFLAEPVVAVEDDSLLVSGLGANGACDGDSGGPLMVRDGDGRPVVAGVLTAGAPSCVERDRYVRLDGIRAWLEEATGGFATNEAPCGGISEEGRCLDGTALYCAGDALRAETCSSGAQCGWDRDALGFRCVAPAADPCLGVDSVGACQGDTALRCEGGRLARTACTCGQTCRIDGRTGGPRCAESNQQH
jgi:hypothetical protein